jgi:hypothetical protein
LPKTRQSSPDAGSSYDPDPFFYGPVGEEKTISVCLTLAVAGKNLRLHRSTPGALHESVAMILGVNVFRVTAKTTSYSG